MTESRFGWKASDLRLVKPVAKSSIRFTPFAVAKGDYEGHPFRGNQWTDSSGADRGASSFPSNGVDFDPFGPDAKNYSEQDRRDERIENSYNAAIAYQDAREADLMKLHQLRGVSVVAFQTSDPIHPTRYKVVVRLGGYDTTMWTSDIGSTSFIKKERAEKAKEKAAKELEAFFSNPTLEVKALDQNLWEYSYTVPEGDPRGGRQASKRVSFIKPETDDQVSKGDFVGHPFRGNQWVDSSGASPEGGQVSTSRPTDRKLLTIAEDINSKLDVLLANDARFLRFSNGIELTDRQPYIDQLPHGDSSTPRGKLIAKGVALTEEALNYDSSIVVIEDKNGVVNGAISMSEKPVSPDQFFSVFSEAVDPESTWIEMHAAGSTMAVDGIGSALFAAAIIKADQSGSGLVLSPLDEDAKQFWESKGFRTAEREKTSNDINPVYQFLDAASVRMIADNLLEIY